MGGGGRMDEAELMRIWNQHEVPVILRRTGKGQFLRVRLPYADHNRSWLQDGRRSSPAWISGKRCWEIPKAWFNDFVERALTTFGQLYVIQPYREQEKCSPACLNATGHECQCSCMGRNLAPAMTVAGSKYLRRLPLDGVIRCWPVVS